MFLVHSIFAFRSGLMASYNQVFTLLLFSMKQQQEKDVMRYIHTCFSVFCILYLLQGPTPIQHLSISWLSKVATGVM